jgi:Zn-dependent peptidase ImmA (M78 family)
MPATKDDAGNASGLADLRKAETKALAQLQRFSIETPAFDIEVLAHAMGIEVREGGLEKADAWLIRRKDGKGVLRVNAKVRSDARRRFSIAHELGHWEMHPNLTQGRYCTEADLTDYHRSPEEMEANTFAACLLMPRFLMRERIGNVDPSFAVVDRIAAEFETSRTAAARRLVEVTKHKVILVSSSEGHVDWTLKSASAQYHGLHDRLVPLASATSRVVSQCSSTPTLEPVPCHVWLRDNPVWNPQELFEDVRYFSRLNTALTLLWFI